jgi:hypothetical protein
MPAQTFLQNLTHTTSWSILLADTRTFRSRQARHLTRWGRVMFGSALTKTHSMSRLRRNVLQAHRRH